MVAADSRAEVSKGKKGRGGPVPPDHAPTWYRRKKKKKPRTSSIGPARKADHPAGWGLGSAVDEKGKKISLSGDALTGGKKGEKGFH